MLTRSHISRFLVFALVPWAIFAVARFVYWPALYFILPVWFPLTAYGFDTALGRYTVLHDSAVLYPLLALYSAAVGLMATYFTRSSGIIKAALVYLLVVAAGAFVVHAVAHFLGGTFWYDTP